VEIIRGDIKMPHGKETGVDQGECPVALETLALHGGESRLNPLIRNNPFPF